MKLELVKASLELEEAYYDFIREWELQGEEIVPYSAMLQGMDFKAWLEHTEKTERKESCPSHLVPAHTYFLLEDGSRIIGAVNIRHRLNEYLFKFGGHIGYGIRPSERRKGYADRMLSMALPIARELGIARVLITCDKRNTGSARTIVKNGGVLENEVVDDGEITQRYWIDNESDK